MKAAMRGPAHAPSAAEAARARNSRRSNGILGLDPFRRRIPAHGAAGAQRRVRDLGGSCGLVRHANVRVGRLAVANAIQPVLKVRDCAVAARSDVDVRFRRKRARRPRGIVAIEGEPRPVNLQRAAIPAELEPSVIDATVVRAEVRGDEVLGELERRAHGIRRLPQFQVVAAPGRVG